MMTAHLTPVIPPITGQSGLPAVPPAGKPAIFPLYPRGYGQLDVCAVIRGGAVEFVARDVLHAVGMDLGEYGTDRSHDAPTSYLEHATARTWSRTTIALILDPLYLVTHNELIPEFLRWLDEHIDNLEQLGLDTMERKALFGSTHRPTVEPPTEQTPSVALLPQFYSVTAAARILSRDPGIGKIGRDGLFDQMHKLAWVVRAGDTWKPARDLVIIGYLLTQHVKVPTRPEAYPQLLITPFGIEALHTRLGGTATLTLAPSDHLTLIEATQ